MAANNHVEFFTNTGQQLRVAKLPDVPRKGEQVRLTTPLGVQRFNVLAVTWRIGSIKPGEPDGAMITLGAA